MIYRGHVKQGIVVFDHPTLLADGTAVQVQLVSGELVAHHALCDDFWEPHSMERLLKEQVGATQGQYVDRLGGWPEEDIDDDFEISLHQWRSLKADDAQ